MYELNEKLAGDTAVAEGMTDSLELAKFYQATILSDMEELRKVADEAEQLLPKDMMPYPTYADMLFYV